MPAPDLLSTLDQQVVWCRTEGEALRLAPFIWPDQPGRLSRLEAACRATNQERRPARCHPHGARIEWLEPGAT